MELLDQLEELRILDSEFFGIGKATRLVYEGKNDMLDECLEIVYKWLKKQDPSI